MATDEAHKEALRRLGVASLRPSNTSQTMQFGPVRPQRSGAQRAVETISKHPEPALLRDYILEFIRKEKVVIASAQALGSLNNLRVFGGHSSDEIVRQFSDMAATKSLEYGETLGIDRQFGKLK